MVPFNDIQALLVYFLELSFSTLVVSLVLFWALIRSMNKHEKCEIHKLHKIEKHRNLVKHNCNSCVR